MASGDLAVQDNRIMSQLSDHRVSPQPSDSPQIIPVYSPGVLGCRQPPGPHPSVRGGVPLTGARSTATPHAIHTATPLHATGVRATSRAGPHVPVFQPLTQLFGARSQPISRFFDPHGVIQAGKLEYNWSNDDGPCGTVEEYTEGATPLDVVHTGVRVGADNKHQEEVLWSYGSGDARNDPRLSHASRAEGDVCLLSPGILQDASLLLSMVPNILDEPVLYNQTWSFEDMIRLDGFRILESVITCSWVSQLTVCNETLKVKDIKIHLKRKHGVKSRLPSGCFWNECTKSKQMMLPSLARHIKERHTSSIWPCPTCDGVFTRDETLLRHFKGCKGPSMSG